MGELLLALPPFLPQFPHLVRGPSQVWAEKSHTGRGGGGFGGTSSPCLRSFTDLRRKPPGTERGTQEEARESWTPSPFHPTPAYKISVFISKGTCAEAVGEEKRETKETGGRGQGESLIQTRKWMLSVEA